MEANLEHEDLLIKLRAKLNDGKIKLWEPPYTSVNGEISQSFQELSSKLASELSLDESIIREGLLELQQHSVERSKANEEYKETGCATLRVKATGKGDKGTIKVMKKLDVMGSELVDTVAAVLGIEPAKLKLIFNGKLIKPDLRLEEQGVKNGIQLMALIMTETPEEAKKEDDMYMQVKGTLEDATLLSECMDELIEEDEYMNLEDQTGKSIDLPKSERRSLFVGLALHERGRTCIKKRDYSLALVLLLEADRQLCECRAQILNTVDNYAVLQLDIAWCYLCLQSLQAANDAAERLAKAEVSFKATYGEDHRRLIELKGTDANERVLFMRLYLLQGIVAYHQNKRDRAAELLLKAEKELTDLRVDDASVQTLMELGWSRGQACSALRACAGDLPRAQAHLDYARAQRDRARIQHREEREQRLLGVCADGSPVSKRLVESLQAMGFPRELAVLALRNANNSVADAVRVIQEQPELLDDSDMDDATPSYASLNIDQALVDELQSMGFTLEQALSALHSTGNDVRAALDILMPLNPAAACNMEVDPPNPSTSSGVNRKRQKKEERLRKKKARDMAVRRLRQSIHQEDDDYLTSTLSEEEHYLVQYKSLL
ncbi:NEDD8 ultimate buster 1-like [Colias croceus]|uniref:NEDD8 ultimate buster 1-like n=1 Tax=Colias crocea TaxID=72248 RepID=UPI001E27B635|nr:NEDD8 ultimate buster 1-like [Colias croceus]